MTVVIALNAKWIEQAAYAGQIPRLKWRCHTANSVGYENMKAALENADRYWTKGEP